jgi:hypothetical protein
VAGWWLIVAELRYSRPCPECGSRGSMEAMPVAVLERIMRYAGIKLRPGVQLPPGDTMGWLCWDCGNGGMVESEGPAQRRAPLAGGVGPAAPSNGSAGSALRRGS